MKDIPAGSIDMILCDLPYGMLSKQNPNTKWDAQLDLQQLRSVQLNDQVINRRGYGLNQHDEGRAQVIRQLYE